MLVALVDPLAYTPPYDHALASALADKGHAVTLLTSRFPHGRAPEPDGYTREELFAPVSTRVFRRSPLRLAAKWIEYAPSVARLLRRIERLDPDVVHVQWLPRPEVDLRWLRRMADDRPVVLTAHDVLPRRRKAMPVWPDVLETAERIVVHSERAVEQLVELGLDRERIARILHPVFPADPLPPPEGRTLLFFGLIRAYKGVDLLLRALPLVARDRPDVRLVVAGDPLDPIEPLQSLATELGVNERIDWRLGFLPDDEVADVLAAASVVVLPYRRRVDASGVLALAIGHGLPIVASDVGSLGETVTEFGLGEVVPPEDVEALAAACVRLLGDDGRRDEAVRGAAKAREALTWEAAAREHEALYAELVRDHARPGESLP